VSEFKLTPIGVLNKFEQSSNAKFFSRDDSSIGHLRNVVREVAVPSAVPDTQYFLGEVLYVFPDSASEKAADTMPSVLERWFGDIGFKLKTVQIVARIPELHALLPVPKTYEDLNIIKLYPTFSALNEGVPLPEVGQIVYLDFKNRTNLEGGIYIGTFESSQGNIPGSPGATGFGGPSASQAFDTSTIQFSPMPPIDANFSRVKDVRATGEPSILSSHDKFPERKMKQLDTIVLHQTADSRATNQNRPRLESHVYIDRGGTAYIQYDFELYLPTSHNFNSRPSVGFEIEGHMAGVVGAPPARGLKNRTHWVPSGQYKHPEISVPQTMPPEQVEAAKQMVRYVAKYMQEKYGVRLKFFGTHRQTYRVKASDPGEEIMMKVAQPMMRELGMQLFPGTLRDGRPNPEIWGGAEGEKYLDELAATRASGWTRKTSG
jgi:hypothetical protein